MTLGNDSAADIQAGHLRWPGLRYSVNQVRLQQQERPEKVFHNRLSLAGEMEKWSPSCFLIDSIDVREND